MMYQKAIKPIIDILLSTVILIVMSPVFVILIIILTIANKGKPFFMQPRPGKNSHIFKIIKFKTMNDKKDIKGKLLPDAERITNIGNFVRKTSLDELPQLLNVIKGDMSLVGPRPLLPQYLSLYNDEQNRRHDVKPGITGWAQINGRNAINWKQKFELDVWYIDNYSWRVDLKIIYYTIFKVFKTNGINASDKVTMEAFNGKN